MLYGWFIVVACIGLLAVIRRRRRSAKTRRTTHVLTTSLLLSSQHGHNPARVEHLALALLICPEVARELDGYGVPVDEIFSAIECMLMPSTDPLIAGPYEFDDAAHDVIREAHLIARRWGDQACSPMALLHALLRSNNAALLHAFDAHGVSAKKWPPSGSPKRELRSHPAGAGPYRGGPAPLGTTDVVFWNDNKTTQTFVGALLRDTFGNTGPQAMRLVFAIDQDGYGVVGTYPRQEAERLAGRAVESAREQGFPLRVSAEPAGRIASMSPLARWLRYRT